MEHQRERLVHRVVGAVAEHDTGPVEPCRSPPHEVDDGTQFLDRIVRVRAEIIIRREHGSQVRRPWSLAQGNHESFVA